VLLFCVFGKCGVTIVSDNHGSDISFGTRKAPAQQPSAPAEPYQGKVNPAEFDTMFSEQQ